ncbi:MAG TPA: thiamine phosphate synthase, partial [Gemmatimonadales bacterium]|nr:thiamine phosphate synthase [Gemmatimonadales bacterium]
PDLGRKAAAIAALGSGAAIHLRDRTATTAHLAELGRRLAALVTPPEAALIVTARADLARALGAAGVQLGAFDLGVSDARTVLGKGWIGRSVHSVEEGRTAVDEGADYLVAGNVFDTPTHPGRPGAGLALVEGCAALGRPVIAIGGVTAERAGSCRAAGAWGVAAIRALWDTDDPYASGAALLAPWREGDAA